MASLHSPSLMLRKCSHRAGLCYAKIVQQQDEWKLPLSWQTVLVSETEKPYFVELQRFVEEERAKAHVLPARRDQFAAFRACDFERVKCVILGQDP
eukprot:CAMPEP_0119333594 /NCGR_PEP_ID=MMETSP1333-20130426/85497_1 /TAXON_ID=418940 /ORGANISM="Scyphosphaera apsteinii, Strain RCC1455" /LENGTH=95 /DNA_ID=CAMNT_0007343697 /DNA_START=1 /DNA_END=285 /DNA_ORIENTATION=+